MNAKQIARQLELIKYFTLRKSAIYFNINADIDQDKEIENEYVQLSGNYSFKFESIIVDYAKSYSSNLKQKTLQLYFYKKPNPNSSNFELIDDPNGLMTPAIINDYIKDERNYKRYIFPSHYNHQTYSEWYSDTSMDIDKRATRSYSMNIIVDEFSVPAFNSFLNESLQDWTSRFSDAVQAGILGNFDFLYLYDPRIFKYALTVFEDRKKILTKLLNSTNWYLPNIFLTDEFELFVSLINNINDSGAASLYNYMFEIDSATGKTNLHTYKDILPSKLYDELIKALMRFFYFYYQQKEDGIKELVDGFIKERLFPIGFLEKGQLETGLPTYFDLDEQKVKGTGLFRLGIKYNIKVSDNFSVHIESAVRYKYNPIHYLKRIEYEKCPYIGDGNKILNYNDIVYVSPFLANQEFNGLNIPSGSVMPIPAFALKWLIDQNEETQNIIGLVEKAATIAGVIFPILEIYQAAFIFDIFYEAIGLGFTLISNTLGNGLQDQIKKYDESKSTSDHPYTKGEELLSYYYLLSSIYGFNGLKNAVSDAKTTKAKLQVLSQFETILSAKGVRDDFRYFMSVNYPEENIDIFNNFSKDIDEIEKEFNLYKYLQNQN